MKYYEDQVSSMANFVNVKLDSELKKLKEENHDEEYLNLFVKGNKNRIFKSKARIFIRSNY